ncbi:MAG: TIGR02391 family protein [Alphaproteobacteria bacterium]|nr:TIGR02391 family protein [Alphaproteobacteria bacterium]
MYELASSIPDIDTILALEPEELGCLLTQPSAHRLFLCHQAQIEPFAAHIVGAYPGNRIDEFVLAYAEAWAWLEAQGLLVPAPGANGTNGWRVLSRRAQKFENEEDFAKFAAARRLPKDALHPALGVKVWSAFMRGEYDVAVLQAMKAVEVSVRGAAGLSNSLLGKQLMQEAFKVGGPLADDLAENAEQQARMYLFMGAIGSYKNPHSHRDVKLDDPSEAIEIVMFANHLLRIVDVRKAALELR